MDGMDIDERTLMMLVMCSCISSSWSRVSPRSCASVSVRCALRASSTCFFGGLLVDSLFIQLGCQYVIHRATTHAPAHQNSRQPPPYLAGVGEAEALEEAFEGVALGGLLHRRLAGAVPDGDVRLDHKGVLLAHLGSKCWGVGGIRCR